MTQIAEHLIEHGRTPVGWDDELVAGATLPKSQVVMSWHGDDNERVALTALQQGHDVVMTPQESLYFDHYQSALPDEWAGPPPPATLRQAYDTIAETELRVTQCDTLQALTQFLRDRGRDDEAAELDARREGVLAEASTA
jgi:N-acetyl-beta-hexosaminidase